MAKQVIYTHTQKAKKSLLSTVNLVSEKKSTPSEKSSLSVENKDDDSHMEWTRKNSKKRFIYSGWILV